MCDVCMYGVRYVYVVWSALSISIDDVWYICGEWSVCALVLSYFRALAVEPECLN